MDIGVQSDSSSDDSSSSSSSNTSSNEESEDEQESESIKRQAQFNKGPTLKSDNEVKSLMNIIQQENHTSHTNILHTHENDVYSNKK